MAKLLPNLTIQSGVDLEDGEILDLESDFDLEKEIEENNQSQKSSKETLKGPYVYENKIDTFVTGLDLPSEGPKVYENKNGTFVTGLDLSSEALMEKLNERAKRFGLDGTETAPITQNDIDALYKSLEIDAENLNPSQIKNIRLEVLHMRGVEEMDNDDIFNYFKKYGPARIEWINDFSCNVAWLDETTAARALLGLSEPWIKNRETKKDLLESKVVESPDSGEMQIADLNDNYDEDRNANDINMKTLNNLDACPDGSNNSSDPAKDPDIPIPPGCWRLGNSHPKAKAILLRFATKDDKKLQGAAKRSQYYQKYGNPNYGGLKGLISTSKKRKMQAEKNKLSFEKFLGEDQIDTTTNAAKTHQSTVVANRRTTVRMKMYADEEENRSFQHKNVRQRLGTKYSADELLHLGREFSSESETEDPVQVNCTIPSQYGIWNDLAMDWSNQEYAEERKNKRLNSVVSGGHQKLDLRSSLNLKSSRQSVPRFHSDSRKRESEYKPGQDLRSKIAKIKGEDSVMKHRSPLYMDD